MTRRRRIYGGVPHGAATSASVAQRSGVDVVVGDPGPRCIDHLRQRRTRNLGAIVEILVLDEADRMLDIGFRPDIERILRRTPQPRQTMLLSATISPEIRKLAQRYMYKPVEMNLSKDEPSVETIQQFYLTVEQDRKFDLLVNLIDRDQPRQCIIFTRTKRGADKLAEKLGRRIKGVSTIHGDLAQSARNRVMQGFREGTIPVLVATDVVGRGIDVEGISHVVNFDIPDDPENYLHRIGRTGRMGKDGVAYLFVCPDQGEPLTTIENLINKTIPVLKVAGFEASLRAVAPKVAFKELFSTSRSRSVVGSMS